MAETLVHMYDVTVGLSTVPWQPCQDSCDRVLARLFPQVPADDDRWRVLLWVSGRTDLPG